MKRLLISLLIAVTSLLASPAEAHDTSYCGTGTAGIWEQTWFAHHHWVSDWRGNIYRLHHYRHTFMGVQTHEEHRRC